MSGESGLYKRLRDGLNSPDTRIERVENGLVDGMPDVNYCFAGHEGWIELKAPDMPKRPATPLLQSQHQLSVAQANWFLRQSLAGGTGFLLIGTTVGVVIVKGLTVGRLGTTINKLPLNGLERISAWSSTWNRSGLWEELRAILCDGI